MTPPLLTLANYYKIAVKEVPVVNTLKRYMVSTCHSNLSSQQIGQLQLTNITMPSITEWKPYKVILENRESLGVGKASNYS